MKLLNFIYWEASSAFLMQNADYLTSYVDDFFFNKLTSE